MTTGTFHGRRKKRFLVLKRNPKIFIPTPRNQIVIPFHVISLALIFVLSLLCVYLTFRSDLFLVHKIELESVSKVSAFSSVSFYMEPLRSMIEEEIRGRSIFFLDLRKVKDKVLRNFLTVYDVQFKKDFPNWLKIKIYERKPVAVVEVVKNQPLFTDSIGTDSRQDLRLEEATDSAKISTGSATLVEWFAVDYEGLVFVKVASFSGLPVLYPAGSQSIVLGDKLSGGSVSTVVELLAGLKRWEIKVAKINLRETSQIRMILNNGTIVFFSSLKDPVEQVTSLQLILSSSKIKGKNLSKIDLSFDKPVIVYKDA
jgi:hypothetical protein